MSRSALSIAAPEFRQSIPPFATSPTTGFGSGLPWIEAGKRLQDGSDTRNQRPDNLEGFA